MAEKEEERKRSVKNKKTNFKPGRKPAISTKKSKNKSKPKTQAESMKKAETTHLNESDGIKFSHIVILISLITIIVLALIIYLLVCKKNQLETDLNQDKMDNLIDQASELSDEAHAKDLYILENIQKTDNTAKVEISKEDLSKIKSVRDDFIDAYEDLDWEDVSNLLVNGLSTEQRALLEGLKIREITTKHAKEVKYTNNNEVYYEINIVVRKKGNSNYEEGDNTRYLVFKKVNDEYKVDLVEKIN